MVGCENSPIQKTPLLKAHWYTLRHVESLADEEFEKLRLESERTSQGVNPGKSRGEIAVRD
jgi:hypothetical protein